MTYHQRHGFVAPSGYGYHQGAVVPNPRNIYPQQNPRPWRESLGNLGYSAFRVVDSLGGAVIGVVGGAVMGAAGMGYAGVTGGLSNMGTQEATMNMGKFGQGNSVIQGSTLTPGQVYPIQPIQPVQPYKSHGYERIPTDYNNYERSAYEQRSVFGDYKRYQ